MFLYLYRNIYIYMYIFYLNTFIIIIIIIIYVHTIKLLFREPGDQGGELYTGNRTRPGGGGRRLIRTGRLTIL